MPNTPATFRKVSDQIRADLLELIRQGQLLPGVPIDEAALAKRYEVSKTPVREALLQLEAQGLLQSLSRGGMVLVKMNLQELLGLFELLAEIEAIAVRLASERMTTDEFIALEAIHHESKCHAETENLQGWQKTNEQFHEVIYHSARNAFLRQDLLRIRARTGAYRLHAFGAMGSIYESYVQHGLIVEALRTRDSSQASRAMITHILPASDATKLTSFIMNIPKELLAT
jgi:DNA-binding GntR family transcriptional regulator